MRRLLAFFWRPNVAFWGTIAALVLYFLSAGPLVWILWQVRLPDWLAVAINFAYCPFDWAFRKSKSFEAIWTAYRDVWVDTNMGQPATPFVAMPDPPAFFLEACGTLLGCWLVWNFVRWVNQLKPASSE